MSYRWPLCLSTCAILAVSMLASLRATMMLLDAVGVDPDKIGMKMRVIGRGGDYPEQSRARAMREFLGEKKFRPGLEPLRRPANEK